MDFQHLTYLPTSGKTGQFSTTYRGGVPFYHIHASAADPILLPAYLPTKKKWGSRPAHLPHLGGHTQPREREIIQRRARKG